MKPEDETASEPNFYEVNRSLFEELDRETTAAHLSMAANDMDTWSTHAWRAAEIHKEIAERAGWSKPAGVGLDG